MKVVMAGIAIAMFLFGIIVGIVIYTGIMDMNNINQERIDSLNQDILNQMTKIQECENQTVFLREVIDRRTAYAAEVTFDSCAYQCAIERPTDHLCVINSFNRAMDELDSYAFGDNNIYSY